MNKDTNMNPHPIKGTLAMKAATPFAAALFSVYGFTKIGEVFIVTKPDVQPVWSDVVEYLKTFAESIDVDINMFVDESPLDWLIALANTISPSTDFNSLDALAIDNLFASGACLDEPADIQVLIEIALLIDDGHNFSKAKLDPKWK